MANNKLYPHYDPLLVKIADYVVNDTISSPLAFETARLCLADSLGCAMLALTFPACKKLIGPWVEGTTIEQGARVVGTSFELDPIKAAFDIGTLIRWLDYNDTWLAQEWAHPSDNLGAILSVMDFVSRRPHQYQQKVYTVKDVLEAMIKAYEIQGVLTLTNSFNQVGLDHVILVKIASTAVVTKMMGGTKADVLAALSQAWIDGQSLRTYRHAPNTGSRKSWAAGDATSRAVRLAMITLQGEMGYPTALSTKQWGFQDVAYQGKPLSLGREFGSYVMENILFKISYPAEFHAQTAVECALVLHPKLKDKISDITKIEITSHQAAMRIINKTGPLYNPADRDHCLQYMVACALIDGKLTAQSYEDERAKDKMIDELRYKMHVKENKQFSMDYLDPDKRSIANRLDIYLKDGKHFTYTSEYPMGHKRQRERGLPLLWEKFEQNCASVFPAERVQKLLKLMQDKNRLLGMTVPDFIGEWLT